MSEFSIDETRFNNVVYIDERVALAPKEDQGAFRTALAFLYKDEGPINLPRDRLLRSRIHLDPTEQILIQWLQTRTNGKLRKAYGAKALIAARKSRYRCSTCNFADVRALNLDHVDGRTEGTEFSCLCANCHTIKSRNADWTGKKRVLAEEETAI